MSKRLQFLDPKSSQANGLGRRPFLLRAGLSLALAPWLISASSLGAGRSAQAGAWSGFEDLAARARELARRPYEAPEPLPVSLQGLGYDAYRSIRYRPDRALWRDARPPFEAQFFHLGYLFTKPVRINVVSPRGVEPIAFSPDLFSYGEPGLAERSRGLPGFAGFRIHYPLNDPAISDELAVFLGASYFRVLGRATRYGASARAIAIDTGGPSREEFPDFREFWLVEPAVGASSLEIFALLEGPSVVGAYRFVLQPGDPTVLDIDARLFFRRSVDRLGLAPLNSMCFLTEGEQLGEGDYRPEVHDSDGLQVAFGTGEWLWRPLVNPRETRVTALGDVSPRGFGLLQRDRSFRSYEDLEARYELRPSLWVEPRGNWGAGAVELVEIPADRETVDNIVAFWAPDAPVTAGASLHYGYRLTSGLLASGGPAVARVVQTRNGRAGVPDRPAPPGARKFVVEFSGGGLPAASVEAAVIPVVNVSRGTLLEAHAEALPGEGHWRAVFDVLPADRRPVELRCFLRGADGGALSETWSYLWQPLTS